MATTVKPPRDKAYYAARSDAFRTKLLQAVGAPVTPENLRVLEAWTAVETGWTTNPNSGTTLWNPLNSTRPSGQPGESRYNAAGVRNYPTEEAGVNTLAATLSNYPGVLRGLRANDPAAAVNAIVNSPWVTSSAKGAYKAPGAIGRRDYTRSSLWAVYQKLSGNTGQATTQRVDFNPDTATANPAGFNPAGFNPAGFLPDLTPAWLDTFGRIITSADFWKRFAYMVIGVGILIASGYLLFKDQTVALLGKAAGLGKLLKGIKA